MPIYRCPKCKKEFNRKHTYEYHIYEKKFSCTNEPIEYDIGKSKEKSDDKSQLVLKRFECHRCHNIYATKSNLNRHINGYCTVEDNDIASNSKSSTESESIADNESLCSGKHSTTHDLDDHEYDESMFRDLPEDNKNKTGRKPKQISSEQTQADQISSDKKQCSFCKNYFSKTNFSKHEKICRLKSLKDAAVKEEVYIDLRNEMEQLKALINKLQSQKPESVISAKTANINSNNNIQNINNDIKIVAFGKEDLYELLDDETAIKYLNKGYQSVYKLIEDMHFDPNKPEFHSVYISNTQNSDAITFDGDGWKTKPKDEVVDQLFDDKSCYLTAMFKDLKNKNKLDKSTINKYTRFMNETNEKELKSIKMDIKRLLYDKNSIPRETRNKMKTHHK